MAREITKQMLDAYDKELSEFWDKRLYRGKGKRNTTIKTVYIKGNTYLDWFNHHTSLFDVMQTTSRKAFKRAFCK